jgi:hypothetical protein
MPLNEAYEIAKRRKEEIDSHKYEAEQQEEACTMLEGHERGRLRISTV